MAILAAETSAALGEGRPADRTVIKLWDKGAPGALGETDKDTPTLTVYWAAGEATNRPAMVILPGGGYGGLASHEGEGYALWLNTLGIDCFVVKYRLGSSGYRHPRMLEDAARAVRQVRFHATDWGIESDHIGIIGSSAGGHLAATLITHFDWADDAAKDEIDGVSARPDLAVLCYPVITMGDKTHSGSRNNLLGPNPSDELIKELSNERQVTAKTPPCLLFHTFEDKAVPVDNSLMFAEALNQAGVPFELHIYEKGGHGMGLGGKDFANLHPWTGECQRWLAERGFGKGAGER